MLSRPIFCVVSARAHAGAAWRRAAHIPKKAAKATRSLAPPPHYKEGMGMVIVNHGYDVLTVFPAFCTIPTASLMIAGWFSLAATEPPSPLWIVEPLKCTQN